MDWDANANRILNALRKLSQLTPKGKDTSKQDATNKNINNIDLVLFPELSVSGYGCEDAFHHPSVWHQALENTHKIAILAKKILPDSVIILGLPFNFNSVLYNCSAVIADGKILALVPKTILAGDGIHYEPRWFGAFKQNINHIIEINQEEIRFGLMAFEHKGIRFIIENCRDAWGLTRPAYLLRDSDYDLVLNPSASSFSFDKYKIRRNIVLESSRRLGVFFVLSNLLGCEAGRLIYDGHLAVASGGKMIGEQLEFSFHEFVGLVFSIDPSANRSLRTRLHDRDFTDYPKAKEKTYLLNINKYQKQSYHDLNYQEKNNVISPFAIGPQGILAEQAKTIPKNSKEYSRNEQFLTAQSLALFDYLRKSKARGFVISLSGGADSSICALLVYYMLAYAINDLGLESTIQTLGRMDLLTLVKTEVLALDKAKRNKASTKNEIKAILQKLMPHFLHTVYQATNNNTQKTRENARQIAKLVYSKHAEVEIQDIVDSYLNSVESFTRASAEKNNHQNDANKLRIDDLSLQNIQARTRAPLAWLIANQRESILICTANRSEIAVGYCTKDGDTAGGLAPLASLSKSFLMQWLSSMQNEGEHLFGPVHELSCINSQKPSAELRPNQEDELDLMPYELLDKIIVLYLHERKAEQEILQILKAQAKEERSNPKSKNRKYKDKELEAYTSLFFTRLSQSQWKRESLAPSFHIEEESLDPRSYYRYPIFS